MNTTRINFLSETYSDYSNFRWRLQIASKLLALITLVALVAMVCIAASSSPDLSREMGFLFVSCVAYGFRQCVLNRLALYNSILETIEYAGSGRVNKKEPPSRLESALTKFSWKAKLLTKRTRKRKNGHVGLTEIAKSRNRGRTADMERYLSEPIMRDSRIPEVARRHGLTVSPQFKNGSPYSGGKCLGSALYYARDYLLTGSIEKTAKQFEEGAPYEAILLQHKYSHVYCNNFSDEPLSDERELNRVTGKIAAEIAGLEVTKSQETLSIDYTLEHLSRCDDGVYLIQTLVDPSYRGYKGRHAMLVIKEKGRTYFYDPNRGTYLTGEGGLHSIFAFYGITENLPYQIPILINKLELPPGPGLNLYSSLT